MSNTEKYKINRIYKNVLIEKITRFEGNSRIHSESQIQQIVKSIQAFGFTNPCLIDEKNNLIAGHGRLEAALILNMVEVPCLVLEGLTETQRRALILADNKIALNAGWDFGLLKTEFEYLTTEDFDLDITGFDLNEIDSLFSNLNEEIQDISEIMDINESVNFSIKCKDLSELEALKTKLKTSANKMSYDEFLQCL